MGIQAHPFGNSGSRNGRLTLFQGRMGCVGVARLGIYPALSCLHRTSDAWHRLSRETTRSNCCDHWMGTPQCTGSKDEGLLGALGQGPNGTKNATTCSQILFYILRSWPFEWKIILLHLNLRGLNALLLKTIPTQRLVLNEYFFPKSGMPAYTL